MTPMFRNASQAVHFAYVLQAYPAGPQSTLSASINMAKSDIGRSGIDFAGMDPADIRVECDRIRRAVRMGLPDLEACALEAKFSQDRRERERAITHIAKHLRPALAHLIKDPDLLHNMTERHYTPEDDRGPQWSLRALAAANKVSKDRLFRASALIEAHARQLEIIALDNLRRKFEERELINKAATEA